MTETLDRSPDDTHELAVETYIDAPPQKVWEVMTEQFTAWWCPRPWRKSSRAMSEKRVSRVPRS